MADDTAKSIIDNLANVDQTADSLEKAIRDRLAKLGHAAEKRQGIAGIFGSILHLFVTLLGLLISIVVQIATPLVSLFLKILTKTRTNTAAEQVELAQEVLSEMLQHDIELTALKNPADKEANLQAARIIGKGLLDRLTKEFVPASGISNTSGEAGAEAFVGFAVNFGVQNTIISTLADAVSFHLLENFRELGVEVAQNIGLGRLVRQAIAPLIRNSIAQPYDRQLRARYRQDQVGDDTYIKAWFAERLDESGMREMLAQKGYSDRDTDFLLQFASERMAENDLLAFVRYGVLTQDQAVQKMVDAGVIRPQAQDRIKAALLRRQDDQWSAYIGVIINQVTSRRIDLDAFNKLLDRVPYTDEEKQVIRDQIGGELEVPTSFLTWSEVTTAFENGIIDLDYVDAWLVREGFSEDDQLNKELLLLIKFDAFTQKADLAAKKKAGQLAGIKAPTPQQGS